MKPKVSIVIPVFNSGEYLKTSINSVVSQTYKEWELILIDDCSEDKSFRIMKEYQNDRIKILQNKINRGPSYSRNFGIENSSGSWIAFLDSDDWFHQERLEELVQTAKNMNADVVADNMHLIKDNSQRPWSTQLENHNLHYEASRLIDLKEFLRRDCGYQIMVKRQFLEDKSIKFREDLRHGEDNLFLINCLAEGARFALNTRPLYYYRSREGSLTRNKCKAYEQRMALVKELVEENIFRGDKDLEKILEARYEKAKSSLIFYRIMDLIENGEYMRVAEEVKRNPVFFKTFMTFLPKAIFTKVKKCQTQ